jgi:hypothetical protein
MKVMKHLLASLFVLGTVFTGTAMAAEKAAEPAAQTEQRPLLARKSTSTRPLLPKFKKRLWVLARKKRKPSCNTVKNTARLALSSNY